MDFVSRCGRADTAYDSSSRSLKRWIFPVAVRGRSTRTSIQRGYFHKPARSFTCTLQRLEQAVARRIAVAQHDEGLRLDQPVGVLLADHRGFQHRLVRRERGLDLERRHPHAAHLEHVVGAAAVVEIAVGVAHVFVAGIGPFAREGAPALGALVPVAFARRRPAHDQLADLAVGQLMPVLVDDPHVVAGHRLAGRAVAHVVGPVAQEGLEHLGRADAVEHVAARGGAPALAEMRRQRLAGRDAQPQPVGAGAAAHVLVREQRGVERRHAVEDRRAVPAHELEHAVGRRPRRQQHGGGADRHRERHGVAHAVGEEQLRGREHDVVRADADHALAHQPRRAHRRGVHVLDALGVAGRARRVHPERHLVGQRRVP